MPRRGNHIQAQHQYHTYSRVPRRGVATIPSLCPRGMHHEEKLTLVRLPIIYRGKEMKDSRRGPGETAYWVPAPHQQPASLAQGHKQPSPAQPNGRNRSHGDQATPLLKLSLSPLWLGTDESELITVRNARRQRRHCVSTVESQPSFWLGLPSC